MTTLLRMHQLLRIAQMKQVTRIEYLTVLPTDIAIHPASKRANAWRVVLDASDLPGPCIGRGETGEDALRVALEALDAYREAHPPGPVATTEP